MDKELALAGAALAGQMTLAGLILVYQGFVVSWWRSQIDSDNRPTFGPREFRAFLMTSTASAIASLTGTLAPILVLTGNNLYSWVVPAVLVLSIVLVIAAAIEGSRIFLASAKAIAPRLQRS